MFKSVHHVHYVIKSRDEMVAYIENNFGMSPESLDEREDAGIKNALYRAGETIIEFSEPTNADSTFGQFLRNNGPGVFHVAWRVEDIHGVARDLMAKGNTLRGETGVTQSAWGYNTANIDTKDSFGLWFQLAEDPK